MNNPVVTAEKNGVMKMKQTERRKEFSLVGTLLRSVVGVGGLDESGGSREEIVHTNNTDYHDCQIIKTALLEAEHRKAEALTTQRSHFVC